MSIPIAEMEGKQQTAEEISKQQKAEEILHINICKRSCKCCVDKIYTLIRAHADAWKEIDETRFAETPLHTAAAAGNTAVAVEILNLMPSLGRKLNKEGMSPLHLAIEGGNRDTARVMARLDKQLVRVKGRKGMTPLMQCAARGDSDEDRVLLARLLVACPESVSDVNNRNQTVVHVALEHRRSEAVLVVVDWLRRRDQITSVLSVKDDKGNTVLHTAAKFGCDEAAKEIVKLVKLNRLNSKKETALDIAIKKENKVADILKAKGAKREDEISRPQTTTEYVLSKATNPEAVSRAYYYLTQELTLEMRNAILVVAVLIVAATYQGVLQPPGGVFPAKEESIRNTLLISRTGRRLSSDDALRKHLAGQMVMQEAHYRCFMPSNTFAFALSIVIIIFVVPGSPIFLILHLCLVFMCLSYLLALDAISYYTGISHMIFVMALYAVLGAYFVKLMYYPVKALLVDEDWWLRGPTVKFANYSSRASGDFAIATREVAHRMKKQQEVLRLR